MVKILKNTVGVSVGLTLLALTAHVAQAGTRPCPSCGGGSRPRGQTPPPNFVVPLPNGGTFVLTPPPPNAPVAPTVSVSAPAPTVSVTAPAASTVSVTAPAASTVSVTAPVAPTVSGSVAASTASASGSVVSGTTFGSIQSGVNGFSGGLSIGSSISGSGLNPSSVVLQIMTQKLE